MPGISCDITIKAPRDQVFDVFSDIPSIAERIEGIKSVEMLSDGPVQVGTRWKETRIFFKKEATEEMWFTEFTPHARYVVEAESHGCHYVSTYDFSDSDDGTVVSMNFESRPVSFAGKLFSFMGKMMMKTMRDALMADMNDLKAHLEARQPDWTATVS